jgi:predicted SAM-dependent methyltransferase
VCSADVLEHIPGSAIDSVISKLTRAGRLQFHVIACYDDGHSHLAVYSPATWLALFRRHLPEAYIFDIKPRFDDPNRLICVISNFPPEDQNNFDTPPQRPGRTSGVRRTAVEALLDRGEPIRLDVGSASTRPEGFLTVDVRPESGADIVADVRALPAEFGGRVSEIRARHVLEHLSRSDARAALRHWHDILVPGGRLNVIVPDIAFHARQFLGTAESTFESQFEHAMAGFYGWSDPERGGHDWDMHRWGYSEENLRTELLSAGFDWVERALDGSDPEPWHLNLWAHKPMADGEVGT